MRSKTPRFIRTRFISSRSISIFLSYDPSECGTVPPTPWRTEMKDSATHAADTKQTTHVRWRRFGLLTVVGMTWAMQAQAQRNTWPQELPAAHSWFMCSSQSGEPVVAWVDQSSSVVAVSSLREDIPLPVYASPMLQKADGDRFLIQQVKTGYRVTNQSEKSAFTLQVGATALNCSYGRDE